MNQKLHFLKLRRLIPLLFIMFNCCWLSNVNAQTYCTVSSSYSGANNYIVNVVTTGGAVNISNASAASPYTNYTATHEVSGIQGTSINITVNTCPSSSCSPSYLKIWVDWNQNGTFDLPGEEVYALVTGSGAHSFTSTITIPLTSTPGSTRMRIASDWFNAVPSGYPAIAPCTSTAWGEAEDYKFTVIAAADCDEVTYAVGTLSNMEVCPSNAFTVSNVGTILASGVERVWQQRTPSGTGTWTTIAGATGVNYTNTTGITAATDYRCIVTCSSTSETDTTNVSIVTVKSLLECYCSGAVFSTVCSSTISNVFLENVKTAEAIVNLSNLGTSCGLSAGGYSDYKSISATVMQNTSFKLSVKHGSGSTNYAYRKAWIDWNRNGIFEASELVLSPIWSDKIVTNTVTVNVPATASPGATLMRVMATSGSTTDGPCAVSGTWAYGEVEDYTINILPMPNCDSLTIDAGAISSDSVCMSSPFTIMNPTTTLAFGLERIWQSRTTIGTGSWTTIAGAITPNLNVAGITIPTEYRLIVKCTATGDSDTSNIATMNLKSYLDCYCSGEIVGFVCSSSTSNMFIEDVYTEGAITNLSNLGTACATGAGGYSDYTSMSATVMENTNFRLKVKHGTHSTYSGYRFAWIDWNKDGIFSPSEKVLNSEYVSSTVTSSVTINVPIGTPAGPTRMRVIASTGSADGPCSISSSSTRAEVEDYIINVVPMPMCDTIVLSAGVLSSTSICPSVSFEVPSVGGSLAFGVERIWQKRLTGTSDWETIAGATAPVLVVGSGITSPTQYRLIISCTATGDSDTSNIAAYTIKNFVECYCTGGIIVSDCASTIYNIYVDNVSTEDAEINLSNLGTGCAIGALGYSNYTSMSATVKVNNTFTLKVKGGSGAGYGGYKMAWIDWNQDGIFSASEKVIGTTWGSATAEVSVDITVPFTALPGTTRMRVMITEGGESYGPCEYPSTYSKGEIEDYSLKVIPMPNCDSVDFPSSIVAGISPNFLCAGPGTVNLYLTTEMPEASAVTFLWHRAASKTGAYTALGTPTMYYPNKSVTATDSGYYFLQILCNGLPILHSDTLRLGVVNPSDIEATFTDGQTCGPGPVTLSVDHSDGEVFWYENLNDFVPVYIGTPFVTPNLTADQSYYVTTGASPSSEYKIGTGSLVTQYYYYSPLNAYGGAQQLQYMYTAEDLHNMGADGATSFSKLGFDLKALPSSALTNYKIKYKLVSTAPPLVWQTSGWTNVFTSASVNPTEPGWYYFDLNTPIEWDGFSNIIFEFCYNIASGGAYTYPNATVSYTNIAGRMRSSITGAMTGTCSSTSSSTYTYLPHLKLITAACENERVEVTAYVRPVPDAINIGMSDTLCIYEDEFITLDAGSIPDGHVLTWDDGSHTSTRNVNTSGTYYAVMNNEFGCISSDTVVKLIKYNPIVALPTDTTVCLGGILELDAGGYGVDYYWNNSQTTQKIIVEDEGMYSVVVTAANGCYTLDTTMVTIEGVVPTIDNILVTNVGSYSFNFKPINPLNVTGYLWSFGDGNTSTEPMPTHTYGGPGNYTVTLELGTHCGGEYIYETTTHIVSIDNQQLEANKIKLYPNPAHEYLMVENEGKHPITGIAITTIDGRALYEERNMNEKNFRINLNNYASGMYLIRFTINGQTIFQKFEIMK